MLQIFVKHNIRIRGASTPLKSAITKALTFDNPAYVKARKQRRQTWGIPAKLELFIYDRGDIVMPRGFLSPLEGLLKNLGYDPGKIITSQISYGRDVSFGEWNNDFILKADQTPMVEALMKQNGIGVAPAGSGKTVMGMRYIYEKGKAALWLTHTKDLMYQSAKRAEATMPGVGRIGFFGDGTHDWGDGKLIVATVQTLQRNPHLIDALNDFIGTVVVDEAHHFPAVQFIETAGKLTAQNMIGLTATPARKDGLEIYMYNGVGPKVYEISRDGMYEAGRLIKPTVKFVYTAFNYETASNRNEIDSVDAGGEDLDYTDLIRHLISDKKRAKLVAENIVESAPLGPAIVITESVRYCFVLEDLVKRMAKARFGIEVRTAVVHGGISRYTWRKAKNEKHAQWLIDNGHAVDKKKIKTGWQVKVEQYTEKEFRDWQVTKQQRKDILEACDRKEVDILFATQLAREGLDMQHLAVGHMVMPKRGDSRESNSGSSVEQEIGRIMRPDRNNPNKEAYWFDYVDYNVGVFRDQYQSRRKVYSRIGLTVPRKPKTERDTVADFLNDMPW
ncbi:DEAD/DEAH box helicase family protein [Bacillus pseudomycoides]|uniref:DEAD/DEAH box helicase family protein n=1 Tax=Bacillus bingmayongensis TaxID=1150157 RepID=A0ABU5JZW9_9BACI|nr:DEAD/DEAH box helicase family protein [Bacillus pseudomycoides]